MIRIPLDSTFPHFALQVELDSKTYGFEFRWNIREEAWFITLSDASGSPIASGQKLVVGFPLFIRVKDSRKFPGILTAEDLSGKGEEALVDDLGTRVQLWDTTAAELGL